MPVVVHAMINTGNAGDTNSVLAVANKLQANLTIKRTCSSPDTLQSLETSLSPDSDHILVLSGEQGTKFLALALQSPTVKELIAQKRLIISWAGHQTPPNFNDVADNMHVVGLLREAVTFNPELEEKLGRRLVKNEFVPNTLTQEILESGTELEKWNQNHPKAIIPDAENGYIAAFLSGDAPDRFGRHKYYDAGEAYTLGFALGSQARQNKKFLLATNGPRTGKFYPQSPDVTKPIPRRFKGKDWVHFNDLTSNDLVKPDTATFAHMPGAPMDPVSDHFFRGIYDSGLPRDQYLFIDYVDKDSAQNAIACAIFKRNALSKVYYGGESISQSELALFFRTFALMVPVMSDLHKAFLRRINDNYYRVGIAIDFGLEFVVISEPDPSAKAQFLHINPERDAQRIAEAILEELHLLRDVRRAGAGMPMLTALNSTASVVSTDSPPILQPTRKRPRSAVQFALR